MEELQKQQLNDALAPTFAENTGQNLLISVIINILLTQ